jgi:hypothetical protein
MRVRRVAKQVGDVLPEVPSPPGTAWHDGTGAEDATDAGSPADEDTARGTKD